MAVAKRRVLLPVAILAAAALCFWNLAMGSGWSNSFATAAGQRGVGSRRGYQPMQGPRAESSRASPITAQARGGADAEAEAVEVSGFSAFVVGLAVLPHVINSLVVSFGIVVSGESFVLGPYGLELISCTTTLGLVTWSIGSFIERGRGLPAGPLGLLGLSEGLSYLGALFLVLAGLVSNTRGPAQVPLTTAAPAPTQISAPIVAPTQKAPLPSTLSVAPSVKTPEAPATKAPEAKKPEVKAPEPKKTPEAKQPEVKAPEPPKLPEVPKFEAPKFEVPKIEVPKFEAPKFDTPKVPEVKAPEVKKPEVKAPEPKKAPEVKKPEVKAPEPAKTPAAKPAASTNPDYDSLFD